jgi:vibriolysin
MSIACRIAGSSLLLGLTTFAGCGMTDQPEQSSGSTVVEPVYFVDGAGFPVRNDLTRAAVEFIRSSSSTTHLDREDWSLRSVIRGLDGLEHIRLDQTYDNLQIWGADVVVHVAGDMVSRVNGSMVREVGEVDTRPELSPDEALAIAKDDYAASITSLDKLEYSREKAELLIYPHEGKPRLAWHTTFYTELQAGKEPGLWNKFVDAHTGEVIDGFNAIHTLSQASGPGGNAKVSRTWSEALDVEPSGSQFRMDTARLVTVNMNNGTSGGTIVAGPLSPIGDAAINDAHGFAEITLNMLQEWYGHNSINDAGFKIRSRVHYGRNYENAFWDGTQMTYGDGASLFYPLSGDVDVVSHEINHGFTSFHSNLVYSGQSGGNNESFSDIAGTIAEFFAEGDAADWDLGRDIFRGDTALRFMCNPTADGRSIDHASNFRAGMDVHYSSGVMNKAFCRTARRFSSGNPDGNATQAGVRRAGAAWYLANADYWTSSSNFVQACQGVFDAAVALGFSSTELGHLRQSWIDVGVTCGSTQPGNQPPTVSITEPANGSTVSGTVTVSASATDPDGTVARVVFTLPDGSTQTDTSSPYSVEWNSASVNNGSYQIRAQSFDTLGAASTTASVSVSVNNGGGGCIDGTFNSTDVPKAIPDNNATGITSVLPISGNGRVSSLQLSLNITHTWRGDLAVQLVSPQGTSYTVHNRSGGSADNLVVTNRNVTTFNNQNASGTWQLKVQDRAGQDLGTLTSWSLRVVATCN